MTSYTSIGSPRMISYHFANKDDLIRQVLTDILTSAGDFLFERIAGASDAPGKLRAYVEANLEFLRDHVREIAVLTEIGPHVRTDAGERYTSRSAQEVSVQGLEKLLSAGQSSGELRDFDVRSVAIMIRGTIDAAAAHLREEPDFDLGSYRHELLDTLLPALLPRR